MAAGGKKGAGTAYHHYILREDEHPGGLLAFQTPYGKGARAHPDEHLFIVTHQTFELWFKQLLEDLLRERTGAIARVEAGAYGPAATLVRRLTRIVRLLADQYGVIETLSPTDFLKFRDVLRPSSGYDSAQFRALELASGLRSDGAYLTHLTGEDPEGAGGPEGLATGVDAALAAAQKGRAAAPKGYSVVKKMAAQGDLAGLKLLRRTLAGTSLRDAAYRAVLEADEPALKAKGARHSKWLKDHAKAWAADQRQARASGSPYEVGLSPAEAAEVERRVRAVYQSATDGGARTAKAWALFELLEALIEYDEAFRNLRAIHVNMVLRVIGGKTGTGGSSGAPYLRTTLGYSFFPLLWRARTSMDGPGH